ncbi:MAG TPA: glycosyltransferase family 2 protein [Mycobacteriales bacterium]|nr:glycosyltransferase family 2 protein [Mycobacteriales bacterium]
MRVVALVAGLLLALPGLVAAVHLGLLAIASWFYREPRLGRQLAVPELRFCVLVPAHNEERVLDATLAALRAAMRPYDVLVVVADRCTDSTADIARRYGAEVLERGPADEPGRAAARQDGLEFAEKFDWDVVAFVDADSIIEPGFFTACERVLASDVDAVQARSEAARGTGLIAQAYLAAFALQGVTIPRGRDRLRLSVRLRGTGMVLRRHVLAGHRFRAPASEDLFYSLDLCLDGILPRHVESAKLRSANVGNWSAAANQRVRYEAGRMAAAKELGWPLLRARSLAGLEAAVFLLTPPIAVAAGSLLAGATLAWLSGTRAVWVPVGGLGLLGLAVVTGLVQARAGVRTWLALLAAPWYVAWKVVVQARAWLSLRRPGTQYGATPRA